MRDIISERKSGTRASATPSMCRVRHAALGFAHLRAHNHRVDGGHARHTAAAGLRVSVDSNRVLAIDTTGGACLLTVLLERGTNGHWKHLGAPARARGRVRLELRVGCQRRRAAEPPREPVDVKASIRPRCASSNGPGAPGFRQRSSPPSESAPQPYGSQIYGPALDIHDPALRSSPAATRACTFYRRGSSGWTESGPLKFPDAYDYTASSS